MDTGKYTTKYNMNHSRIILVGGAASGKDHMRKLWEDRGFKYAISYTTRPPREGEVYGEDYFFLTKEDFLKKAKENFWYEYIDFNGWYYGTSNDQFYKDDIFIMTVSGVSKIKSEDRESSFIIFINTPESVRRSRLEERNMPGDSTERRLVADNKDLEGFKDYDITITNKF